ncbi:hypothetical protein G6F46_005659 [Rhizopus delemar]|uniref:Uncharacterized protein n=2 Tax=Rhizopus TaxID=4842 RepID=A0A9P6Z9X3_9FUNG|nr:hypothetical protein G6F43_002879 [Rhizopus delemar]KAG1549147.1 hypothetical protein G6F51_003225 [Rhizopus arrhizus]KAG1460205.1 hypothetical protein G6F55_004309 [Rhizopus delemar]KAG1502186.1 hypothetical protein G6F54_002533 [Rhizopus delemar]KAG1512385.1 hypothetical protein G6F53_005227 [Rhizopus delemar]
MMERIAADVLELSSKITESSDKRRRTRISIKGDFSGEDVTKEPQQQTTFTELILISQELEIEYAKGLF